jgi:putative flippase GtrA
MPYRKVTAGALAGAMSVILIWILHTWMEIEIPPEVASAITVVMTFATSYIVAEPAKRATSTPKPKKTS